MSAVICAYTLDRWSQIERALDSVVNQSSPPDEIVLVVDHNEGLLKRAVRRWPEHRVITNAGARGLSGARNTGVSVATGDLVAFLDDDAVAEPTWLERLLRHFSDPEVVGAGGRVEADWSGTRPAWFPEEFDWVVGCSYVGMPQALAPVRNPIGASMLFRRPAIIARRGFTCEIGRIGSVPLGCEETELSIRIRTNGGTILYDPSAVVRHTVTAERATAWYYLHRCWAEGRSKAAIQRLVGRTAALESERAYVVRTLPAGFARNLVRSITGPRRASAFARAAAIALGLVTTTTGYAEGRVKLALLASRRVPGGERK